MKLYDHVKIKSSGITGVIVDIFGERFTVESDTERVPGDTSGYPGRWHCSPARPPNWNC